MCVRSIMHRLIIFNSEYLLVYNTCLLFMHWYILDDQVSWHEMSTDSYPESKIWRLTGYGAFGSGFGVNFSDSTHLWYRGDIVVVANSQ